MTSGSWIHSFGQAPRLGGWLSDDRDSGRGQPGVHGADIPYLDPDHRRALKTAGQVATPCGLSLSAQSKVFGEGRLPGDNNLQALASRTMPAVGLTGASSERVALT
jgi:hypothetical protein